MEQQKTSREKLIDKVKALLAKTTESGCTEEEELSALAKARAWIHQDTTTANSGRDDAAARVGEESRTTRLTIVNARCHRSPSLVGGHKTKVLMPGFMRKNIS
jgi:uncharacterized protein DUF2786